MQICPQKGAKNKFSPQFSDNFLAGARLFLLPGISEEGFDVGVRDRLAVDFFETGHQQLHVLDGDMLARTVVEAGMDFLSGHNLTVLFGYANGPMLDRLYTDIDP